MRRLTGPVPQEAKERILGLTSNFEPISLFELGRQSKLRYDGLPLVLGVGAVVIERNTAFFALSKESYWLKTNTREAEIKLIGGAVEPGETFQQAVIRELEEETGCVGAITGAKRVYHYDPIRGVKPLRLRDADSPILIHEDQFQGLPGQPNAAGYWNLFGAIFSCSIPSSVSVVPKAEVPGIVKVPLDVFRSLPEILEVDQARALGVDIVLQPEVNLEPDDLLRVGASLRLLQKFGLNLEEIS